MRCVPLVDGQPMHQLVPPFMPEVHGHGPCYLWTRAVAGCGAKGRQLSAAKLYKVCGELANYEQFAGVSEQIAQVSEAICEARSSNRVGWRPGRDDKRAR